MGIMAALRFNIGDFRVADGRVTLRKTGNSARLDGRLAAELWRWGLFWVALRLTAPRPHASAPALCFSPEFPGARYQVRQAAIAARLRLVDDPAAADAVFRFEDATLGAPAAAHARTLNGGCRDISKSRVAAVFAVVFGYPLAIDPAAWAGDAVEKSEANGTHDGRIVMCPRAAAPGRVYQRVVDAIDDGGAAVDLRTQCIGHQIVTVWEKRRPAAARFLPPNTQVIRRDPTAVFSAPEQERIASFTRAMGADWCALDVLRDRGDGRIYIVDVNTTDAGPIIALPLREKLAGARRLGAALRALVDVERLGVA